MTETKRGTPAPPQRTPPPRTPQQEGMGKMLRFQMIFMVISFGMIFVITNGTLRSIIGTNLGLVLMPAVGFGYNYPILTIILLGVIVAMFTSVPRYFFTDWMKMGRIQNRMRAFNKVFNEAMRNNQRDKMQKLQKMRMEMSMEQSQLSMSSMKPMMAFTIVTLLLITWLYYFMDALPYQVVAFPWNYEINVVTTNLWLMPYWIIPYFVAVMLFGYIVTMIIKYFDFSVKMRKLERKLENEDNY